MQLWNRNLCPHFSYSLTFGATIVFLALAFFVRTSNLESKFFWIDEVSSSFVITGHWPEYIESEASKMAGQKSSIGQYQDILEHLPDNESKRLVFDLMERDPQHSPLYFVLSQKWAAVFGAQPSSLRLASSLLSFIGVPVFAWLCVELFGSIVFGVVGLGVLSLAPFHILFSQQVREYGFWFTMCALSTALLLAANRTDKRSIWIAYGFSVSLSLYTFLFSIPFFCGHFLFQWSERKSIKDKRTFRFLVAAAIGFIFYVPWLVNIFLKRQMVEDLNKWSAGYLAPNIYLQSLILNFSRLFVDFNLPSFAPLPWDRPLLLGSILLVVAFIAVAFFVSVKCLPRSKKVLILSSIIIPFLFLLSMDILKGQGIHALVGRQLMPSWLGVYLAMTYLIGVGLQSNVILRKYLAAGIVVVLLIFGSLFSLSYIPQKHWWPLKPKTLFDDAGLIESSKTDLLIISQPTKTKEFLSMSYSLRPELSLLILKDEQLIPNLDARNSVALYKPSDWIIKVMGGNFRLEKTTNDLWIGRRR